MHYIFFTLGILAVLNSFYLKNPAQILWLCYLSLVIIGFGILKRNSFLIMSQIYILAIPLLAWDIDFVYYLITQSSLWGITDYFFAQDVFNLGRIISLQHLFTIPISIYSVYLIGLKRRDAWKLSAAQIVFIFILVNLFVPNNININCVYNPCVNFSLGLDFLPYQITWFLVFFLMVLAAHFLLNSLLVSNNKLQL